MHLPEHFPLLRHCTALLIGMLAIGVAGCANYQLGTGNDSLPFRTLHVAPVGNSAALPQAVGTFSRELRNAFATDGRVQLAADPASADAVLEIDLADFNRSFTSVQPGDTALARKFDLQVTARCTLRDARTGQVYFENNDLRVTRQIFVDDGQNPAEYQVQPQLAASLADRVVHRVLDLW
jgi:hypothetical protein